MSDRQAFETHLEANPYDFDTRRVFSDWLEQEGFDDEAIKQRKMATHEWENAREHLIACANAFKFRAGDDEEYLAEDIESSYWICEPPIRTLEDLVSHLSSMIESKFTATPVFTNFDTPDIVCDIEKLWNSYFAYTCTDPDEEFKEREYWGKHPFSCAC